jgi:hypothetical protein
MNEEGSCAVVVRFLEPIIDGTPGSEALGENCVSDQVWLTKSVCSGGSDSSSSSFQCV